MTAFEIITCVFGSGIGFGIIALIFKMGKIAQNIETMNSDIKEIKQHINNIDSRLNHLEGAFFERGQWEAKTYKMARKPIDHQDE